MFKLIKNKFMITIPNMIYNYNIDGYFAAYLKKIRWYLQLEKLLIFLLFINLNLKKI